MAQSFLAKLINIDDDIITSLAAFSFKDRDLDDKFNIINTARRSAVLGSFLKPGKKEKRGNGNTTLRNQISSSYIHYGWLAGSKNSKKLYCWPCLLYSADFENDSMWVRGGYFDLESLEKAAEIHNTDHAHIKNITKYDVQIQYFPFMFPHNVQNEQVIKNRKLFKKLAEVTMIIYKQGYNLTRMSEDRFKKLFQLFTAEDEELKRHCEHLGDTFTATMKTFLSDCLFCIDGIIWQGLYKDLFVCDPQPLVSIQVNCVPGIFFKGRKQVFSRTLRYVDNHGIVQHRFVDFYSYLLPPFKFDTSTIISQSFQGYSAELIAVKTKLETDVPCALIIPSIDHQLNQVLLNGTIDVEGTWGFVIFMNNLVQNQKIMFIFSQLIRGDNDSCTSKVQWKLNSELLTYILKERANFLVAVEHKLESKYVSIDIAAKINHIAVYLKDVEFVYFLLVFNDIFQITDELSNVTTGLYDINIACKAVKRAIIKLKLLKVEGNVERCIKEAMLSTSIGVVNKFNLHSMLSHIVDNIITHIKARFIDIDKLEFLQLVNSDKFKHYTEEFPDSAFSSLTNLYGSRFQTLQLKKELQSLIYSDQQFYGLSVNNIFKLIQEKDLRYTFPEAYKLFCLVATLPITVVPGCGPTTLDRINDYLYDGRHNSDVQTFEDLNTQPIIWDYSRVEIERTQVNLLAMQRNWLPSLIDWYMKLEGATLDLEMKN